MLPSLKNKKNRLWNWLEDDKHVLLGVQKAYFQGRNLLKQF